jgi:hypothetical protein
VNPLEEGPETIQHYLQHKICSLENFNSWMKDSDRWKGLWTMGKSHPMEE